MLIDRCPWMTVHLVRFKDPMTARDLDLSRSPDGAVAWRFGVG